MTLWHFRGRVRGSERRQSLLFSENKFSFINFPPVKSSRLRNVYTTDRFPFLWLLARVSSTHVMWPVQAVGSHVFPTISGEMSCSEMHITFHHLLSRISQVIGKTHFSEYAAEARPKAVSWMMSMRFCCGRWLRYPLLPSLMHDCIWWIISARNKFWNKLEPLVSSAFTGWFGTFKIFRFTSYSSIIS